MLRHKLNGDETISAVGWTGKVREVAHLTGDPMVREMPPFEKEMMS